MVRVDAYDAIRRDVLARIERRRLRPEGDLEEVRNETGRAVDEYQRRAHLGEEVPLHEPQEMIERVLRSITDFGPLTELVARRDVEEIFIEGARVSFIDGDGRLRGLGTPTSEEENRQIVERFLATTDRQLNTKQPVVQARVLQGSARLTAAIPPVADQLSATLRRYTVRNVTLEHLVARDSLDPSAAAFLHAVMQVRSRVAISGEPGAGKTTMAAALLAAGPPSHCVRSCEEIRELSVPITHGAYYEVRPASLDGTGEIGLRDLVKFVLAMRPDRIVVGEVRGAEAFELTRAVNAGCGFLCTVHANGAPEALHALGERRADGGGERARARRPPRVLRVPRPRRPSRSRRHAARGRGDPPQGHGDHRGRALARGRLHVRADLRARRPGRPAGLDRRGARAPRPARRTGDAGRDDPAGAARRPGATTVTLVAALCVGACFALAAGFVAGVAPRFERRRRTRPQVATRQVWLNQAGVALTPAQFALGSALAGVIAFAAVALLTGAPLVAVVPAAAVAALPRAYFAKRRTARLREVQYAWPDGLRDLLASVAAGRSLTAALTTLAHSGPAPLRTAFARFPLLARMLGTVPALEVVKEELADPTSDRVLEVLVLAQERGGRIVSDILEDLVAATTRDLKVLDEIETEGLEMRINACAVLVLPWFVLVALDRATRRVPVLLPVDGRDARRARRCGAERDRLRVDPAPRPPGGRAPRVRRGDRGDGDRGGGDRAGGGRPRGDDRVAVVSTGALVIAALSAGVLLAGIAGVAVRPRRALPRGCGRTPSSRARTSAAVPTSSRWRTPTRCSAAGRWRGSSARRCWPSSVGSGVVAGRDGDVVLARRLRQAGWYEVGVEEYRVRTVLRALAFGAAGAVLGVVLAHSAPLGLLLAVLGAVHGTARSRGRLDRAIEERRERIRLELYTVNQLLAMHLRTGAGPVQATQRIVDRGHGAVVEELDAVLTAVRSGMSEADAFRRAADLTPEPGAARTYRLFAAGAERGVDLGRALRALSEDLRDARREEIRKTATKRRAAMLVPTIAVLAPIMLLFVAAPLPSIVFGHH